MEKKTMKTPRFALKNLFLETLAVIVDVNVSVEKKVFVNNRQE